MDIREEIDETNPNSNNKGKSLSVQKLAENVNGVSSSIPVGGLTVNIPGVGGWLIMMVTVALAAETCCANEKVNVKV